MESMMVLPAHISEPLCVSYFSVSSLTSGPSTSQAPPEGKSTAQLQRSRKWPPLWAVPYLSFYLCSKPTHLHYAMTPWDSWSHISTFPWLIPPAFQAVPRKVARRSQQGWRQKGPARSHVVPIPPSVHNQTLNPLPWQQVLGLRNCRASPSDLFGGPSCK